MHCNFTPCDGNEKNITVKFHDTDFEKSFRRKYGIEGSITEKTILGFTELDLSQSEPKLRDISDIAMFKNLTYLNLGRNEISDITPLAGLANLTKLILYFNQISDITPLITHKNLTVSSLEYNQISDITPLAGLVNLTCLYLTGNQISDVMPLAKLVNLTTLHLCINEISNKQKRRLRAHLPDTMFYC